MTTPSAKPAASVDSEYAPVVEGGYRLHVAGQGYLYRGPRFDARIAPDGTVSFRDKHGKTDFVPFAWLAVPRSQRPPALLERTPKEPSARKPRWIPPGDRAPPARKPDQGEICPNSSSCGTPISMTGGVAAVTGGFDLDDELMRRLGQDPYAREKASFLSATFEFRTRLAASTRQQLMKETLDFFPQRLEALWADTRYSPRERRRILYQIWAQADSTPQGKRVAEMIDLFIERRLSCGTPDGYSPAEIESLRTRDSHQVFAPGACKSRPGHEPPKR